MITRLIFGLITLLTWLGNRWVSLTANSRIRFSSVHGDYWAGFPPTLTRLVQPKWLKAMVDKAKAESAAGRKGIVKFVRCPGMHDFAQEGYLILAHADIHIKANSVGFQVNVSGLHEGPMAAVPMDFEVIDGMAPIPEGVKRGVVKVPIPYGIYMEPGHSAHLIPPLMHADYLDKLFVYPGTVDYDDFHVANWIISAIAPCDFVIPAGTPLLHVLPFKRVGYHGITGPANKTEVAQSRFGFPSRVTGFYRKHFHSKKFYTNEVKK